MNRAQRRLAERNDRRGIVYEPKVIPLPPMLDEFTVFDFVQTTLDKLQNGGIESLQGVPIFYDNHGTPTEIVPALEGWIFTWRMINEKLNANLDLAALERISNKMRLVSPMTPTEVIKAKQCLDTMRVFFRSADRKAITTITKTAQIAIFMQDLKDD